VQFDVFNFSEEKRMSVWKEMFSDINQVQAYSENWQIPEVIE
jgi:hypothetical protein